METGDEIPGLFCLFHVLLCMGRKNIRPLDSHSSTTCMPPPRLRPHSNGLFLQRLSGADRQTKEYMRTSDFRLHHATLPFLRMHVLCCVVRRTVSRAKKGKTNSRSTSSQGVADATGCELVVRQISPAHDTVLRRSFTSGIMACILSPWEQSLTTRRCGRRGRG